MKPIGTFRVVPALPAPLEALRELAFNLWWSWNHPAVEVFRRLDDQLWERCGHNPIALLGAIGQQDLDRAAADPGYVASVEQVVGDLHAYVADRSTWFTRMHGTVGGPLVAYFSAEFGLTECLSIFA